MLTYEEFWDIIKASGRIGFVRSLRKLFYSTEKYFK